MDNAKVKARRTRKYGQAVFATADIARGEVIAKFDGRIYDDRFDDWTEDLLNHTIQIGPAKWRDSKGLARLINHSCAPNCGYRGLNTIVAMRPIAKGEEITTDYEMTEKSWWWRMKCRCGEKECRKVIGSYARMPRRVRKRYEGYISSWLVTPKAARRGRV